jgi:VWFA-related protein
MAGTRAPAADTIGKADNHKQALMIDKMRFNFAVLILLLTAVWAAVAGQNVERELNISAGQTLEIINRYGRVDIAAYETPADNSTEIERPESDPANDEKKKTEIPIGKLSIISKDEVSDSEIVTRGAKGNYLIEVKPSSLSKRIDLKLILPERTRLNIETRDGGILVDGNFESISASTDTGTIAVDVPTDNINYDLLWTTSKPRYLADFTLEEIRERSGGRFQIKGHYPDEKSKKEKAKSRKPEAAELTEGGEPGTAEVSGGDVESNSKTPKPKTKKQRNKDGNPNAVALNFTTARGIVLLNVPPNEVMSDLRERPLTEAAKAIVRSGDSELIGAIRRASPKHFGDFAKDLPPARLLPTLTAAENRGETARANIKTATARVFDVQNRAIAGLKPEDFEVTESGETREVLSFKPVTAPVNLVLLLDVSGSVDNYVNFIRKAARNFVNTVDPNDRVSIILFNEDVKVLAKFTTDKTKLSASLDTFDAGGGTAYYDAIGYTLTETLRPLKGDRTAIVILTDGDDNRSFLPFDSLAGSIEESGALIYPLYVPTSLAAVGATADLNAAVDPLRERYLNASLTSKAQEEGARLAKLSGGVYYPISELSQIQKAYEDIVLQLRTAYDVTFRSQIVQEPSRTGINRPSPRLKIRVRRPDAYVQISRVHY